MTIKTINTNGSPRVEIEVGGDLNLQGWEKMDVEVVGVRDELRVTEAEGVIRVKCNDDCSISLPMGAQLMVQKVDGDADIRNFSGALKIGSIGGDLTLQRINAVELGSAGGDCDLSTVAGAAMIGNVGGDLTGLEMGDKVLAGSVGGDADISARVGDIVLRAGGDAHVAIENAGDEGIVIQAGGDAKLHVSVGQGIALVAQSDGDEIELDLNGEEEDFETDSLLKTIGDGSLKVTISAGGDVEISDRPWDVSRMKRTFNNADDQWSRYEQKMREHEELIRGKVEEATQRAARATRRAEERVQEAMRRVEQKRSAWGVTIPMPPTPPTPFLRGAAREPRMSEEERSLILQMLQEKKITAEEAERLLEALEGQD